MAVVGDERFIEALRKQITVTAGKLQKLPEPGTTNTALTSFTSQTITSQVLNVGFSGNISTPFASRIKGFSGATNICNNIVFLSYLFDRGHSGIICIHHPQCREAIPLLYQKEEGGAWHFVIIADLDQYYERKVSSDSDVERETVATDAVNFDKRPLYPLLLVEQLEESREPIGKLKPFARMVLRQLWDGCPALRRHLAGIFDTDEAELSSSPSAGPVSARPTALSVATVTAETVAMVESAKQVTSP